MPNIFKKFGSPKKLPAGSYRTEIISLPEECDLEENLPLEIRFIFQKSPEYKQKIKEILSRGKSIGVRTMLRTPENILRAVHAISIHSQGNYIVSWLPKLLKDKHLPKFTEADRQRARSHGGNLDQAVETIVRDRLRFKKLVLIDEENKGIDSGEQRLITELSEIIYPLAVDYSVFRVVADNARERTQVAQSIIKALFIVGPIAHILEKFIRGFGKVFAASVDDLLGESAEIMALRGSGFTWRELARRGKILVPVFALATWGAISVEGFLEEGRILLAGAIFGLSAVALSLTTAVQSIFMYRKNLEILSKEGKVAFSKPSAILRMAVRQDFTNPARFGLLLGAACAPFAGMAGALLNLMHNGWVLALIGSTESIIAGLTVFFADYINEWRFRRKLKKRLHQKA